MHRLLWNRQTSVAENAIKPNRINRKKRERLYNIIHFFNLNQALSQCGQNSIAMFWYCGWGRIWQVWSGCRCWFQRGKLFISQTASKRTLNTQEKYRYSKYTKVKVLVYFLPRPKTNTKYLHENSKGEIQSDFYLLAQCGVNSHFFVVVVVVALTLFTTSWFCTIHPLLSREGGR